MKSLITCLSLILLLSLLESCNPQEVNISNKPTQNADLDIEKLASDTLTIIMAKNVIYDNDAEMAEYTSELLADAGWDVEFKFFDFYPPSGKKTTEEYQAFIMEEFNAGKNLIFENMSNISPEGFLGKQYLVKDEDSEFDYTHYLGHRKEYKYQGVYIQKELDELYGEDIKSIEDYNQFLYWAKTNNPNSKPCLMVMQSPQYDAFNPISLFAQASGYIKLDHAVHGLLDEGSTIYLSEIDMYNYENGPPDIYEAVELSFFSEMDRYLNKWTKNGLLEFTSYDMLKSTDGYSSLVLNLKDTTNYYSKDYTNSDLQLIDVSDFNLYIVTENGTFPDTPFIKDYKYCSRFYVGSKSISKSLGLAFLEWIYSSSDNYHLFMFGKEHIDYKVEDGHLEFLTNPNGLSYGEWKIHEKFIDDSIHPVMPHFPANWDEFQHNLSDTDEFVILGVKYIENKDSSVSTVSSDQIIELYSSLSSTESGVYGLYEIYFVDIGKDEGRYTAWDLGVDIAKSVSAQKRISIWTEKLVVSGE